MNLISTLAAIVLRLLDVFTTTPDEEKTSLENDAVKAQRKAQQVNKSQFRDYLEFLKNRK
jgi:hypothetical protein